MKENIKFGFMSQIYEAPHAESIEMCMDSQLLNASIEADDEGTEDFVGTAASRSWDEPSSTSAGGVDPEYIP